MAEYDLEEGAVLTRVSSYELYRSRTDERILIHVHEILSGRKKGEYLASPTWLVRHGKEQFVGSGTTEDEALRDCLNRMRGVQTKDMIVDYPRAEAIDLPPDELPDSHLGL